MKYIAILALAIALIAPAAHADELTGTELVIDGKKYGGYTGSTIKVGDNVGTQGLVTTATTTPKAVTGNTRIIDMMNLLNPEDVQTFINLIRKTGLKF